MTPPPPTRAQVVRSVVLVDRFDSTPRTYTSKEFDVRLRVREGSLEKQEVAGPVAIFTDDRYLVESEGSSFLVSTWVGCQPSGKSFPQPLRLEFFVGEEGDCLGEGDEDSEDVDEFKASLEDAHKVRSDNDSVAPRRKLGFCFRLPETNYSNPLRFAPL